MRFLHDIKSALQFTKQLRKARKAGADAIQTHPVWTVPVVPMSAWGGTMEGCLLAGRADKRTRQTVADVFDALPKDTQHALTFTPKASGEWAARAMLWRQLLRPALPEREFHRVMGLFESWYAHCLRMNISWKGGENG